MSDQEVSEAFRVLARNGIFPHQIKDEIESLFQKIIDQSFTLIIGQKSQLLKCNSCKKTTPITDFKLTLRLTEHCNRCYINKLLELEAIFKRI